MHHYFQITNKDTYATFQSIIKFRYSDFHMENSTGKTTNNFFKGLY